MLCRLILPAAAAFILIASQTPARAAGDAMEGERVAKQWCASCHVVGKGGKGSDKAPAFAALAGNPAKSEAYLKTWISNPHPPMPNFNLTRRTIDDLVAYIRSLGENGKAIRKK